MAAGVMIPVRVDSRPHYTHGGYTRSGHNKQPSIRRVSQRKIESLLRYCGLAPAVRSRFWKITVYLGHNRVLRAIGVVFVLLLPGGVHFNAEPAGVEAVAPISHSHSIQ